MKLRARPRVLPGGSVGSAPGRSRRGRAESGGLAALKILTALAGGALAFAIGSDLVGAAAREAAGFALATTATCYLALHMIHRRAEEPRLVTLQAASQEPAPVRLAGPSADFRQMIRLSRQHLMRIASASADPHAAGIASELAAICATASRLVTQVMDAAAPRLTHANSLEMTLGSTEDVIFRYLALEAGTLIVEETRRAEVRAEIVGEFLPAIVEALHDFGRRLDEPELLELEASIRSATTHLRLEGL